MPIKVSTYLLGLLVLLLSSASCRRQEGRRADADLILLYTTDVHGALLPFDFQRQEIDSSSMASASSYISRVREENPGRVILLDNGDLSEGSPAMYYYNFVAIREPHLASRVMNYMQYDALNLGNHDLEGGEPVYYDHLLRQFEMPWLGANAIDSRTNEPMFEPYTIIEREGYRIAILGLITADTPKWLSRTALKHLRFDSMLETAEYWVKHILEQEKPDMLIGLFHAGAERVRRMRSDSIPFMDGAYDVARRVRGFDLVLLGHDHKPLRDTIINDFGDSVVLFQSAAHSKTVGRIDLRLSDTLQSNGRRVVGIKMQEETVKGHQVDPNFLRLFGREISIIQTFLDQPIGRLEEPLSGANSLVGPSNLMDLVHAVQLQATGADISLASSLSNFSQIDPGQLTMRQLFAIYRYENQVSKMWFRGYEIKQFLEFGYGRQFNQMTSAQDHLLAFQYDAKGKIIQGRYGAELVTPQYNYTSAAGINYEVDVRKPAGHRVTIHSMADGRPFDLAARYDVVLSSYQANGGGDFLPKGLGWDRDDIDYHTISTSVNDIRSFINLYIRELGSARITTSIGQWRVVPHEWWEAARERDMALVLPYLRQ